MKFGVFLISFSVLIISTAACSRSTNNDVQTTEQIVLSFTDELDPISGVELRYSNETFLTPNQASVDYMPDQGPILYDHIELSPRVGIVPITDEINENYPLSLTLPVQKITDVNFDIENVYIMAWGDDGWVKFSPVHVREDSVTIEITEILYDPFVAVIDK